MKQNKTKQMTPSLEILLSSPTLFFFFSLFLRPFISLLSYLSSSPPFFSFSFFQSSHFPFNNIPNCSLFSLIITLSLLFSPINSHTYCLLIYIRHFIPPSLFFCFFFSPSVILMIPFFISLFFPSSYSLQHRPFLFLTFSDSLL